MPTALITGILGQDGSLLAELLLERGYRVVGIARPGGRARASAELAVVLSRCELIELDLSLAADGEWAAAIVAREAPDEVYHLAACHRSSEPGLSDGPAQQQRMVAVNYAAGLALAHALIARRKGQLVLAASSQMYTPSTPPRRVGEQTPHAPSTFYGVTKASCRDAIGWLREKQGLVGSSAIMFNHESPRRSPAFVSRKITLAAARIAATLEDRLELADVSSRVDFSSAFDVVEGLHAMGQAAEPADRVLASGELHTIEELCQVAFAAVDLDWRQHVRSTQPPGERPSLVGDPTGTERELHWQRRRSFSSWVTEMVEADRRRIAEGA